MKNQIKNKGMTNLRDRNLAKTAPLAFCLCIFTGIELARKYHRISKAGG